jgi:hypothetical protein
MVGIDVTSISSYGVVLPRLGSEPILNLNRTRTKPQVRFEVRELLVFCEPVRTGANRCEPEAFEGVFITDSEVISNFKPYSNRLDDLYVGIHEYLAGNTSQALLASTQNPIFNVTSPGGMNIWVCRTRLEQVPV